MPGTLTKKAYEQACQRLANDQRVGWLWCWWRWCCIVLLGPLLCFALLCLGRSQSTSPPTHPTHQPPKTKPKPHQQVNIPGFRKGQKVPEQVLLNAVGGPGVIVNEALDVLCEDALKTAIDEADIKAVGQVRVCAFVYGFVWGVFWGAWRPTMSKITTDTNTYTNSARQQNTHQR